MVEHGHGDEGCKPEEHSDRIEAQYNEWMMELPVEQPRSEG